MDYMTKIRSEWERGKSWVDTHTRDFPELETLADGVALTNQKNAPQVGIVTLANAVREIPRNSVQQPPVLSMEVNGTKHSVDAITLSYLLRAVVFNEDTFGNGILATMQMGAQQALTTGFVALRANVGKIFNKFSTMLETLHWNDIVIEPGVFDASNSGYFHVRTRVSPSALKELVAAVRDNKKDTLWNLKQLEALLESGPQATSFNEHMSAARQIGGNDAQMFDIVTRYGVGPYYTIDVYCPQSEEPLMKIKSKSKFGYPRVSFLVIDPAQLSPFGISRARLASPMANYGNIYLQSTAKMQLLNADAPVFKKGLFTTATPLRRGAQWESVDPNADIQIKELSNSTLEQFNNVMGFVDNSILSTMGVSGASTKTNSTAYQNTDAVRAENQTRDLSSRQVTALIENAIRQYALTAIDLYVSEQVGESQLIVDDEAKDALNLLQGEGFVGDDNVVNVNWEQLYDRIQTWTVKVDLSITPDEMEDKKRADIQDTFVTMKQNSDGDPEAMNTANILGKELIKDVVPEVSTSQQSREPQSMPAVGGEQMVQ